MSIQFTADEMLRVAEQIERNSIVFYTVAAHNVDDAELAALLQRLASWEDGHATLFADMRQTLSERESEAVTFDPDDEILLYLRTFADGVNFTGDGQPDILFEADVSPLIILRLALAREQDSIVFYTGMRRYVPKRLGENKVERIIQEEYGHAAMLQREIGSQA